MTDPESRTRVQSPCNGTCLLDEATGDCTGCRRTIGEIVAWAGMTDAERRTVMEELPARAPSIQGQLS